MQNRPFPRCPVKGFKPQGPTLPQAPTLGLDLDPTEETGRDEPGTWAPSPARPFVLSPLIKLVRPTKQGRDLERRAHVFPLEGRRLTLGPRRPARESTWFRRARRLRAPPPSAPSCRELLAGIRSPSLSISRPFPETFGNHS